MFGLPHQIIGDNFGIGAFIRNDGHLGRSGEHVDAHRTEQRALGFCHELVARPDDHIGLLAGEQAVSHGSDGLHAAQRHDDVGPGGLEGIQQIGVHAAAPEGGGTGDDGSYAGGLGRGHAHVGGSDVRIASGGGVAAHHIHRQHFLTRGHAGVQLHGEIPDGLALGHGKVMNLLCAEFNIPPDPGGNIPDSLFDVGFGHDDVARPFVQLQRVFAHGIFPALPYFSQHFCDDLLGRRRVAFRGFAGFFQVFHGHDPHSFDCLKNGNHVAPCFVLRPCEGIRTQAHVMPKPKRENKINMFYGLSGNFLRYYFLYICPFMGISDDICTFGRCQFMMYI